MIEESLKVGIKEPKIQVPMDAVCNYFRRKFKHQYLKCFTKPFVHNNVRKMFERRAQYIR